MFTPMVLVALFLTWSFPAFPQLPPADDPDRQINLGAYRCADHIKLVEEDDGRVDVRIVWFHGYRSALTGFDEKSEPISVKELTVFSQALELVCREDGNKLVVAAVKELGKQGQ